MKASELRLGNYVTDEFYDSFKTIIEVESIDSRGINLIIEDDGNYPECSQHWIEPEYRFDELRGIPLTEKWLLDFGFDHMGIIFRKSVTHHLELAYMLSINEFRIQTKGNGFTNTLDIKHVHQLQNLYFALTNTELIINNE